MSTKSNGTPANGAIKTEPPVRSQRLQSFKLPRDLSLGAPSPAATANKKVFTPNLNVTRNKATVSDASPSKGRNIKTGRSERGRGRGGQTPSRGRGKVCIQSVGLFSEGIAGQPLRKANQGRLSYNETTSTAQLRRPAAVRSLQKVDEKMEQQSLNEFMNEEEDGDGRLDTMSVEQDFTIPVVLQEATCRSIEDGEKRYPDSLASFFQRTNPQLFLIQLPDTLPGQGNATVDTKKGEKESAEGGKDTESPPDQNNFCLMKGLQEGLIGKFIRHKSGRTKLVLGNTRFDVDLGLEPGFLQEVMSVRTNPTERSGDMINLGKINAKVNVSPDWEDMFQSLNT